MVERGLLTALHATLVLERNAPALALQRQWGDQTLDLGCLGARFFA